MPFELEHIHSFRTGIMAKYPVVSIYLRSNRTNVVRDKRYIRNVQSGGHEDNAISLGKT